MASFVRQPIRMNDHRPRVFSLLNSEITPRLQRIEVFSEYQIPGFYIVGLPSTEINESKERIRAAFASVGFEFPKRRVVLNLSPANVRKQGTGSDLALALSVLLSTETESPRLSGQTYFAWGELGLNGDVRSPGFTLRALKAAIDSEADFAVFSNEDHDRLVQAAELLSKTEDSIRFSRLKLACVSSLAELENSQADFRPLQDWSESRRNAQPRQAIARPDSLPEKISEFCLKSIMIALTGRMHALFVGPKGVGKTTLADIAIALFTGLSEPTPLEALWVRELRDPFLLSREIDGFRPIRKIDVTARPQALTGGVFRDEIVPGEFSLASGGLFIADEFAEWSRDSREILRSPLETGQVILNRSRSHAILPARFQMIATANECPCGKPHERRGNLSERDLCTCAAAERAHYKKRISGPLLDRFGIVVRLLPRQPLAPLHFDETLERIKKARCLLMARYSLLPGQMSGVMIERLAVQTGLEQRRDNESEDQTSTLSFRERHHLVRIALAIAALDERQEPSKADFCEAKSFLATLETA